LRIPAAAANPTRKRHHLIANEARYGHYNQDFANDDNSTIGCRCRCSSLKRPAKTPPTHDFTGHFVAES
jgi:hypothetical protein